MGGERRRSQSLHGTEAEKSCEKRRKQSCVEGREAGRWRREFHNEAERKPSAGSVQKDYTRHRDTRPNWSWVEASVWSERMLAAQGNNVIGGK